MKNVYQALVRFWCAPTTGLASALFRIAFGVLAVWGAVGVLANQERYFSERGLIPWHVVSDFHWASWSLIALAPTNEGWLTALGSLLLTASLGYLVGVAPRVCSAIVFVVHLSLQHRNPYIVNSGDRLFLMLAGLGVFLPLGRACSLAAFLRAHRDTASELHSALPSIWSQRLIQLQICHIYWFSCFSKLRHAGWRQGNALGDVLASPVFSEWPVNIDTWLVTALLTGGTLLFELGFPIAVFTRLRRLALLAGIGFHLSIELTMKIPMFSAVMIVSYALFVNEEEAAWLLGCMQRALRIKTS